MDPIQLEIIAPMIMGTIFILTTGAVLILRPIAKRLGDLLEVMTRQRLETSASDELRHTREILETMNQRLALLEDRQEFTERLVTDRSSASKPDVPAL